MRAMLARGEDAALFSAAIESASDGIVIAHVRHADPASAPQIVYANDAFLRQTGGTRPEVIGRPYDAFFGARTDRAKVAAMHARVLAGEGARLAYTAYRFDGSEYWIDVSARPLRLPGGAITHIVYVMREETERVAREQSLETQNERLTQLSAVARDLFAALEPRALIEALRHGVTELTGAHALLFAALPGGDYAVTSDLGFPARDAAVGDELVRDAARSDAPRLNDEWTRAAIRVLGSSGTSAYVLDLHAAEGEVFSTADVFALQLLAQYFGVAARNVELYGELSARRAAVIELNQIKNDLIAMLAHDFKGPLTTIVGFADMLAENEALDDEGRTQCSMISASAMRLAGLASDTLALSRLEQNELSLTLGDVDVAVLVRDVARTFSVTRPIDVRIEADGALVVRADTGRLRQVIENLIGNAIKYSPGGQPVDVVVRRVPDGAEIAVRDRGIGIPAKDREKLFGRFARASNARALGISGTGFGLYLSKTIVQLHGGRISVESREGHGSTFRVFIPDAESERGEAAPHRILLLDRDGEARSYVAHTLRAAGYAVRVTTTDLETRDALRTELFDLAIVDVDRLDGDASTFRAALAAETLARTGFIWLGALDGVRPSLRDAFLKKPFLVRDLQAAVDAAFAQRPGRARELRAR